MSRRPTDRSKPRVTSKDPGRPLGIDKRTLTRESPIPLYFQLANAIEHKLMSGAMEAGSRFMSDSDLVKQSGLSLLTVRQAVAKLVNKGYIERRQGLGSFVTARVVQAARKRAEARDTVLFAGWDPAVLSSWDAMYFLDIVRGIESELRARGLRMVYAENMLRGKDDGGSDSDVMERAAGAVVLIGNDCISHTETLGAAGLRVVTVNFARPDLPGVLPDAYAGGALATRHLLELGCKIVAHLNSGERDPDHWERVKAAFSDTTSEAGLGAKQAPLSEFSCGGGNIDAGYESARRLWQKFGPVDGIFAGNDLMAIGALRFLHERNVRVPDDVKLIGFDNIEASEICTPQLSSIAVDRRGLGRAAVQKLLSPDEGERVSVQDVALVPRDSTTARASTKSRMKTSKKRRD